MSIAFDLVMAERSSKRLVVLISGRGSNLVALHHYLQSHAGATAQIVGVICDVATAPGLAKARGFGIPAHLILAADHPNPQAFETTLFQAVTSLKPDWIILAGFMRILGNTFLTPLAGRVINIHPSLLPKHRGLNTHQRVLNAAESVHGASIHFVTEELDGGPVLSQVEINVREKDDAQTLAERLLPEEHRLMQATVALLAHHEVQCSDGQITINGDILAKPLVLGIDLDQHGELLGHAYPSSAD